jgi:hypothetical protein
MALALKVRHRRDAHALVRTENGINLFKERTIMRRVFLTVLTTVALLTGVIVAEAAKSNDNFTVRFRENTLVVTSTRMEEARIYSMQGKLLQKQQGSFVEFELDRGTYRLYAKVNGETLTRRIELR